MTLSKQFSPAEIKELLPYLTPEERAELDRLLVQDRRTHPWRPLPGPQTTALECQADITGYGGAAGGGKSDLLCGLILTQHQRSVLFRAEKAQTENVVQRMEEIIGNTDGLNSQKGIWRLGKNRLLELGGLDNPGDHRRWQGRPHDAKLYDEVTEMREAQVRYTMGWNRSANPKQRCRVVMTFNPPETAEGRWVIRFFAPWLDELHPNPAVPGELRWFATVGDNPDYEVKDATPFVIVDDEPCYDFDPFDYTPEEIVTPLSRTFIPSRVTDNPYYMESGYMSTLQALPEPLRSQLLTGDFRAGMQDDAFQVIPTKWIEAAQARWKPRDKKGPMDSIGSDPSRGGKDKHSISRRHGTWFDVMVRAEGKDTPDGPSGAAQIIAVRRDRAPVHIDMVGWGASVFDFLTENDVQTVGINGAAKSHAATNDNSLRFCNLRAEIWWKMREALDPKNPDPIALPPDPKVLADLAAPRWKLTKSGIQVEDKEQIKLRIGRSPDDGDAVCLANITTIKNELDPRNRQSARAVTEYDPYNRKGREEAFNAGTVRDYDPHN